MDKIFIRDFRTEAWIGIYDWEQARTQVLELQIEIGVDTHQAGGSDKIADTIHYGEVVERVQNDLKTTKFQLLEALAEHIANVILHDFKALSASVSVAKLGHIKNVGKLGVAIYRERDVVAPPLASSVASPIIAFAPTESTGA
jgi:7,8-dihydroneopterin aldolase/epimerase/oxygenase